MNFPVLLVIRNKLGAINHTLLTLESIASHGLTCEGIVLNNHPDDIGDLAAEGNRRLLPELSHVPVLCEISPSQAELDLAIA